MGSAPQTSPAEGLGLYLHIPFCRSKCAYCHFSIDPGTPDADRRQRYLEALLAEIEATSATLGRRPPADTVYFGGGTPSLLPPESIRRLIEALGRHFQLDPQAEITLEANPGDLDSAGYLALREAGVNRLSLGVQSFSDPVLREMGRGHSAAMGLAAVEMARRAGFENLSVDLILGWPGETLARWRTSLDRVRSLAPEHVSLYLLEVSGKCLLAHRERHGGLLLPDEDTVADLYHASLEALAAGRLERYEISNLERPGRRSRHNGKYWDDGSYLGFGMSAHSHWAGWRFWNLGRFGAYCRAIESRGGGASRAGERFPSARERAAEALFLALRRREGVDLAGFRDRYGLDVMGVYGGPLSDSFEAGLVEVREGRLRLTERGVLLSNEVFQVFV